MFRRNKREQITKGAQLASARAAEERETQKQQALAAQAERDQASMQRVRVLKVSIGAILEAAAQRGYPEAVSLAVFDRKRRRVGQVAGWLLGSRWGSDDRSHWYNHTILLEDGTVWHEQSPSATHPDIHPGGERPLENFTEDRSFHFLSDALGRLSSAIAKSSAPVRSSPGQQPTGPDSQ